MNKDELAHGEVIIVKRGGDGHDDEHHGGVWKIAFADFMTAMMAFFLVMWLINASNEVTKKAVASYFNPIKLMDTTASQKGVRDPNEVRDPKYDLKQQEEVQLDESPDVQLRPNIDQSSSSAELKFEDQALFVDPYAILSEIAGGITEIKSGELKVTDINAKQNNRIGISNGTSFQDPFDPTSWSKQLGLPKDPSKPTSPFDRMSRDAEGTANTDKVADGGMMQQSKAEEEPYEPDLVARDVKESAKPEQIQTEQKDHQPDSQNEANEEKSRKLVDELLSKIAALTSPQDLSNLDLEIVSNGNGASVVISEKGQNGMFRIGSARPTPELVRAMEKIGEVVADHAGMIEINGHTDGRKYQSADYDNWRLSSARAHMAYYMLVRGGMQESQVEKIAGQAAVNLKEPENPLSAANRRIEVFLKLP